MLSLETPGRRASQKVPLETEGLPNKLVSCCFSMGGMLA
jgi:hypothetical protein